ncbi:transcriptional regulator [Pseudomonas lalucatii]|uniref:Transcriptional regulator n=1 Tax=Pseudomonas lalucatii TaxID=1424203 RepID=A0ABS5Q1L3_9PSED|nr:transcriptional regulator [Pseudomonas lalucatii]MBS7662657.1 transcriptional regulator [Pseudomonas lalucatii]MBS7691089.1 transcriptional regulator [Pseudomonas lalucatii]MBS7725777.1 transcriptional regulator [Pseudomonas lalucatii]QVM88611.1 transcriptional regulator [Pseudomonas lalucatii]
MPRYVDEAQSHAKLDAKTRRKLLDQRRMEYRRAIESYAEQRLLQQQLSDYPELIAANYLAAAHSLGRRSARPAR